MNETSIVVWMSRSTKSKSFERAVRYEQLLPRNANVLAAMLGIDCVRMGLEPGRVAVEALPLRAGLSQLRRIGHFHHDGRWENGVTWHEHDRNLQSRQ